MPSLVLLILMAGVSLDLLGLAAATPGARLPPEWKVRNVRGQEAPSVEVRSDSSGRALRLQGAGRAAWFYRELQPALPDSGILSWSWRVTDAPDAADMRVEKRDDSPIRVYVVFGTQRMFRSSARIIFYTFGNTEPAGFSRPSFASDKLHTIRVDGAGERGRWRDHAVNPFADYRRIWKGSPPAVTAIGVMQDTDQTRAQATAELRQLEWTTP